MAMQSKQEFAQKILDNFSANTGIIGSLQLPETIRIDSGVTENDPVSHEFDSMLMKVIAHGASRQEAIDSLITALEHLKMTV